MDRETKNGFFCSCFAIIVIVDLIASIIYYDGTYTQFYDQKHTNIGALQELVASI